MVALAELSRVSVQKPMTGHIAAKSTYDGISPAAISAAPKPSAATTSSRTRIVDRRADISAPASEPIAMNEPSSPNSLAPLPNTSVAIRAEVIWKFMPNVPAKNTSTRTISILGWLRT